MNFHNKQQYHNNIIPKIFNLTPKQVNTNKHSETKITFKAKKCVKIVIILQTVKKE